MSAPAAVFVFLRSGMCSVAPEQCLRVDASHLSSSVDEDAGGVSFLLFNVLQVVLHLVHRAAKPRGVSETACQKAELRLFVQETEVLTLENP